MTIIRWGLISVLILFLLTLGGHTSSAQSERALYFPESGHWVRGEFLTYYESGADSAILYGAPITDSFSESGTGRKIQYFQKARLVLDPFAPPELRVKQTPLGQELYEAGDGPSFTPNSSDCREFSLDPEHIYRVCYAFLDFFETHGGLAQFGYPISNFEIHNNRVIQFFQNARFEWHPELSTRQHVILGNLGLEYFRKIGEDPSLLAPNTNHNLPRTILYLQVRAFVGEAITPFRGTQNLYVIVQDQNLWPISNADVNFTLIMPSGRTEQFFMPATNENGVTKMEFDINAQSHGVAELLVFVNYDDFEAKSRSSFRIWW